MEFINTSSLLQHTARFLIIIFGIIFAVLLGRFRPEWKSRKTLISWVWTIVAVDIIIMDGDFALSLTAQMFIGGALVLNVINFIGDRIETIKFKDFSASLSSEDDYDQQHSMHRATSTYSPDKSNIDKANPPSGGSGVPQKLNPSEPAMVSNQEEIGQ